MWKGRTKLIVDGLCLEEIQKNEETVFRLLYETYRSNFKVSEEFCIAICKEKVQSLYEHLKKEQAEVLGIKQKGKLVAFLWMFEHEFMGEKRMHINQIVVDKNNQRTGLGKRLIHEAECRAKHRNITKIDLIASRGNEAAIHMYETMDYEAERIYFAKDLK
ncbi:GNAT family N-acetyltransferase [Christensenella minuta]|uniref:GNAT family N-acetyltransferase n=1 Tax=Christensenella minuta TaxID=626937 RepID=UPI0021586712|nr:GNAT family N-acetyltransferase [Christensenella minuta]